MDNENTRSQAEDQLLDLSHQASDVAFSAGEAEHGGDDIDLSEAKPTTSRMESLSSNLSDVGGRVKPVATQFARAAEHATGQAIHYSVRALSRAEAYLANRREQRDNTGIVPPNDELETLAPESFSGESISRD